MKTLHYEGWKIIYLRRKNKLYQALSNLISNSLGNFHKLDDQEEDISIVVDCEQPSQMVNVRLKWDKLESEVLRDIKYHEVVCEDDLENQEKHQETANKIFDFLSLKRKGVSTRYRKINVRPLSDSTRNYKEFVSCVYKNGWEHFLKPQIRED
jgi:hypothetical protein